MALKACIKALKRQFGALDGNLASVTFTKVSKLYALNKLTADNLHKLSKLTCLKSGNCSFETLALYFSKSLINTLKINAFCSSVNLLRELTTFCSFTLFSIASFKPCKISVAIKSNCSF